VNFGTVTPIWPVLNWTQLNGLYPTPTGTSAQCSRLIVKQHYRTHKAAKINIYGALGMAGWSLLRSLFLRVNISSDLMLPCCLERHHRSYNHSG
jgi:hypothetical protein